MTRAFMAGAFMAVAFMAVAFMPGALTESNRTVTVNRSTVLLLSYLNYTVILLIVLCTIFFDSFDEHIEIVLTNDGPSIPESQTCVKTVRQVIEPVWMGLYIGLVSRRCMRNGLLRHTHQHGSIKLIQVKALYFSFLYHAGKENIMTITAGIRVVIHVSTLDCF
jgi:hypothetical protein